MGLHYQNSSGTLKDAEENGQGTYLLMCNAPRNSLGFHIPLGIFEQSINSFSYNEGSTCLQSSVDWYIF